ncbi:hypothetical protein [Catenuloplanes atrovinosus]|uniref:Stress response protein SCP2 n=1 Tax=Catenuloplanes atrovinosus TaxID=137266 RepID=A0AAE4CCD1_9ACTN|nr:hypothetical protein [Catenuloplanes atrovinosus]MDR7279117.1 stress response protein SCP2 [Catenuloplanes atrovinosus]
MPGNRRNGLVAVPVRPLSGDTIDIRIPGPSPHERPFAVLLNDLGRVTSELDLVFPGMPTHPSGAVRSGPDWLRVTPQAAGPTVRRIAVGVLRGPDAPDRARCDVDGVPTTVAVAPKAPIVVVSELVRRDGGWVHRRAGFPIASAAHFAGRFRAEPGGALQRRLGTHLSGLAPAAATAADRRPAHDRTEPAVPAGLIVGSVSLDRGEQASVVRHGERFHAALKWSRRSKDLDLYALYVDAAGRTGATYYRHQGSLTRPPFVCLTSGDRRGKETIEVSRTSGLRYLLICAYSAVENGYGSFAGFHAFAEVDNGDGSVIQVPLHHRNRYSYWVAIALVDLGAADRISVRHVETYSAPGSEARPVLHPNGTFRMDAGPVEFKTRRAW